MKGKINKMAGAIIVVGILMVAGFVTPALAKGPNNDDKEENILKEARSLLRGWEDKLATEGATAEEIKAIIQEMEVYKGKLNEKIEKMKQTEKVDPQKMCGMIVTAGDLGAEIDDKKYFLERCERVREKYGELPLVSSTGEKSLSTVYPNGGWKKTEVQYNIGGGDNIYAAGYDVSDKRGFASAFSSGKTIYSIKGGYGKSSLYYEWLWVGLPMQWQVKFYGDYDGLFNGDAVKWWLGSGSGNIKITYYVEDVWNGVVAKEKTFYHGGPVVLPVDLRVNGNYVESTTFWAGNNRMELWHAGVKLRADSYILGLADMLTNFYAPPTLCWTLDKIEITF
ncbi:MAG: hypothetical protein U9O96_08625 [Candidatus Thermoplasmatota archaeon]|nr:hypothetical protein [Candidatus Thermoplasmatota archaeon]